MHRPVVLGPLVGWDLAICDTGILTRVRWNGPDKWPSAGAQPPNVIIGTIVGTAFAITGVKPDVAVGVAITFRCRSTDGDYLPVLGDVWRDVPLRPMVERPDTRGIERVNYLALLALRHFLFSLRRLSLLRRR